MYWQLFGCLVKRSSFLYFNLKKQVHKKCSPYMVLIQETFFGKNYNFEPFCYLIKSVLLRRVGAKFYIPTFSRFWCQYPLINSPPLTFVIFVFAFNCRGFWECFFAFFKILILGKGAVDNTIAFNSSIWRVYLHTKFWLFAVICLCWTTTCVVVQTRRFVKSKCFLRIVLPITSGDLEKTRWKMTTR